jgi:thymidylate synthase (FAD)
MTRIQPEVFLLGFTHTWDPGIQEWLHRLSGEDCLNHISGDGPERLIELSARRCYKSFSIGLNPNVTKVRTNSAEYHRNILASGHGAVLEHSTATFAFEGVSRVLTHELVRNRQGIKDLDGEDDLRSGEFGMSQESMRYVRLEDIPVWLPPEFDDDQFLGSCFTEAIIYLEQQMARMVQHLNMDQLDFTAKKKLTSCLRRMLPMGIATGIVWTANFRALRWLIEQRSSRHAEREIRLVFGEVGLIAVSRWPMIFGDFTCTIVDGVREWTPEFRKV